MSEVGDTRAPQAGDVLAGKYEVERVLGEGGMGIVVAARHRQLDQKVALKFMHEGVAKIAIQRFMKEAKAVAKLRSENVARVMDVGTLENGAPYIVMEYLEGEDLSALSKQGVVPIADAIDYVLQASVALAEAHASGIVHRDIKPGNLIVSESGTVKVLDFGLARRFKTADTDELGPEGSTIPGRPMGTANYMAPERILQLPVDPRSDLFSLGVILYEMATGRLPFAGASPSETVTKVLDSDPVPLATLAPQHRLLDPIVQRLLAKRATDRYGSAADLITALTPLVTPSQSFIGRLRRLVRRS
jgi:serine/threonine protein kinase